GAPKAGQILSSSDQNRLKLTDDQKKDLAAFQKEVDPKFDKILNDDQKKRLKGGFAFGGPPPGGGGPGRGGPGPGGPPQPGQLVPSFMQNTLKLTDDQKKQLAEMQKEVDTTLDKVLTDEQKKQFKEPQGGGPGGPPQPGQIMPLTVQTRLKLNAD